MFKTSLFLFLSLLLMACGKPSKSGSSNEIGELSLEEITEGNIVPSAALNFDINLKLHNFNSQQEDKVLEAGELIRKVVTSEEFKNAVLTHKYKGKKTFVDNGGMTNAQIYKKIIEGSEKLSNRKDNEMDLDLTIYRAPNNTVGYTYPSTPKIYMNSKYLNKNSPVKVTTNMMHEWLHKLGFKHAKKKTANRKYSVPYAIGYIVAKIAKKIG